MEETYQKNAAILLHGTAVCRGIVIGRAVSLGAPHADIPHYTLEDSDIESECLRFREAIESARRDLESLFNSLQNDDEHQEMLPFLSTHVALITDQGLARAISTMIRDKKCNAEWALEKLVQAYTHKFEEMEDPYLRERLYDIKQVIDRIMRALTGSSSKPWMEDKGLSDIHSTVVVAHDVSPADLLNMRNAHDLGLLTAVGGATSHTSIVAQSMKIPAIVGIGNLLSFIKDGDLLIADGFSGAVIVNPSSEILYYYQQEQTKAAQTTRIFQQWKHEPALTLDGQLIMVQANIESPDEAQEVLSNGGQGIGLFRSEFLFLGRSKNLPDEEEQYQSYRAVLEVMRSKPVVIRTLDLGSDKLLDDTETSANPALGLRGIRYCLAHPDVFRTQLRALLRASAHGNLKILIPMVSSVDEIRAVKMMLAAIKEELQEKQIDCNAAVQLGAMIEVPAAALIAERLLKEVDFLSIGTNDLIQYTLAIDRSSNEVSHLFDPTHPSVLSLIYKTVQAGHKAGKTVSVCGEMAGNFLYTRLLLGLGITDLSMSPAVIPEIKHLIRQVHRGLVRGKVASALNHGSAVEIDEAGLLR